MTRQALRFSLDDFVSGRMALTLAFTWGFAEATFFFIVPDVLMTLIACRALRPALKATIATLAGALAGGTLMYTFGFRAPDTARVFLDYIPAISPELISSVLAQIDEAGVTAVLLGPIKGIPYKIYAVQWGALNGSVVLFLLISIPARYVRFLFAVLATRAIARILGPLTGHRAAVETSILAMIWIAFYSYYFSRFGF